MKTTFLTLPVILVCIFFSVLKNMYLAAFGAQSSRLRRLLSIPNCFAGFTAGSILLCSSALAQGAVPINVNLDALKEVNQQAEKKITQETVKKEAAKAATKPATPAPKPAEAVEKKVEEKLPEVDTATAPKPKPKPTPKPDPKPESKPKAERASDAADVDIVQEIFQEQPEEVVDPQQKLRDAIKERVRKRNADQR